MSNWHAAVDGVRSEVLGAGTGDGVLSTSGAANTKGSYATIGTSNFAYSGFLLSMVAPSGDNVRIDVAVNTGGADSIIVEDLFYEMFSNRLVSLYVPVAVPSGAAIKLRLQGTGASRTIRSIVTGFAGGFVGMTGFRRLARCTDFTNTVPANNITLNGTTFSSWATVLASTPGRISGLHVSFGNGGDGSRTARNLLVEIGRGAAASEKLLGTLICRQETTFISECMLPFIACDIPAGTRIAARAQANGTTTDAFAVACAGLMT